MIPSDFVNKHVCFTCNYFSPTDNIRSWAVVPIQDKLKIVGIFLSYFSVIIPLCLFLYQKVVKCGCIVEDKRGALPVRKPSGGEKRGNLEDRDVVELQNEMASDENIIDTGNSPIVIGPKQCEFMVEGGGIEGDLREDSVVERQNKMALGENMIEPDPHSTASNESFVLLDQTDGKTTPLYVDADGSNSIDSLDNSSPSFATIPEEGNDGGDASS